jgi:RNA ligase (TIGR02306 family)
MPVGVIEGATVTRIDDIVPFPDKKIDRLELARIGGWYTFVTKGKYKKGDMCLYLPPETVIPYPLEQFWLGGSKFTLKNGRVRAITFKGVVSYGLLVGMPEVEKACLLAGVSPTLKDTDLVLALGIRKYEPPEEGAPSPRTDKERNRKNEHPDFKEYPSTKHLKNCMSDLEEGEIISVSEKIHGSSVRLGWVASLRNSWLLKIWDMILLFLGFTVPKTWEYVYGSRRVQLSYKDKGYRNYYADGNTCIYKHVAEKYKNKVGLGDIVYGEIYGSTFGGSPIQKGYTYGCFKWPEFVAYDVKKDGVFLSPKDFQEYCDVRGIPRVPVLYEGPFSLELVEKLAQGHSVLYPEQLIKEGVVVRTIKERYGYSGRVSLKVINPAYYTQDPEEQTEWH